MNITFGRAYIVDGKTYATLQEAQRRAIQSLAAEKLGSTSMTVEDWTQLLVDNADAIVNILTTTESSHPKGRKINGGTHTRKPKVADVELPGIEAA